MVLEGGNNYDLEEISGSSNFVSAKEWLSIAGEEEDPILLAALENMENGAMNDDIQGVLAMHDEVATMAGTRLGEQRVRERLQRVLEETIQLGEYCVRGNWEGLDAIMNGKEKPTPETIDIDEEGRSPLAQQPANMDEHLLPSHTQPYHSRNIRNRRRQPPHSSVWLSNSDSPEYKLRAWSRGLKVLHGQPTKSSSFVSGPLHNSPSGYPSSSSTRSISDVPTAISLPFLNSLAQSLQESCLERIKLLLRRNRELKRRIQKVSLGILPISRVILLGRKKTVEEEKRDMARNVIAQLEKDNLPENGQMRGLVSDGGNGYLQRTARSGWMIPPSTNAGPSRPPTPPLEPFRLLDLPPDLILTIIRHSSMDKEDLGLDLSDLLGKDQWTKIFGYAGDRQTLTSEMSEFTRIQDKARKDSVAQSSSHSTKSALLNYLSQ